MKVTFAIAVYRGNSVTHVIGDRLVMFMDKEVPWTYISAGDDVELSKESGFTEVVEQVYFGMNGLMVEFEAFALDDANVWGEEGTEAMLREHGFLSHEEWSRT